MDHVATNDGVVFTTFEVFYNIDIQTLFLIFKKEQKTEDDDYSSPYFPTFPRGCINLDCAKTNIAFKAKEIITPDKFSELTHSSVISAERYFYSLYGINHYQDVKNYEEKMSAHINAVHKNWGLLREKLMKSIRISRASCYIKPLLVQCATAVVKSVKHPEIRNRYLRLKKRHGQESLIIQYFAAFLTTVEASTFNSLAICLVVR